MKRKEWKALLAQQPRGLSGSELARRIGKSAPLVIFWAKQVRHRIVDGRKNPNPNKFDGIRKVRIEDIDWSQTNDALAAKHGVKRQRIWQLRQKVNHD